MIYKYVCKYRKKVVINKMNILKKIIICFFALLLTLLPLCSCSKTPGKGGVSVVTTIFAPYSFTRELAGEKADVTMLLPTGADSHSYDPTPKDLLAVSKCDIFIYVGGEADSWVENIIAAAENPDMKIIKLLDHTEGLICAEHNHEHNHTTGAEHEHGEYDEHVWTSPRNAVLASEAIAEALCEIDGENETFYKANLAAYKAELAALDAEIKEIVENSTRKELVFGDRFPLIYFTHAYGLSYHAAFPGCAGNTEPSAATLAELITHVNEEKIPAVFHISLSTGNIADAICDATGAKKLAFNACETLSRADFEAGVTYVELMRENAEALRIALG